MTTEMQEPLEVRLFFLPDVSTVLLLEYFPFCLEFCVNYLSHVKRVNYDNALKEFFIVADVLLL